MNMRKPESQSSPQENAVGDHNVERLLASAYQPEALDPKFVQRVHAHARAAAKENRHEATTSPADSTGVWQKTNLWWAVGCTALALVLVAGYFVMFRAKATDSYPDGELVWIDGQPYVPAKAAASDGGKAPVLMPAQVGNHVEHPDDDKPFRIGDQGLMPRRRLEGTPPELASVGDSLITKRGERRRVELPDESVLYLNENASVKVDEDRRITVETGEAFVEVAPAEARDGAPFVVATPQREVTAFGTKFAVQVNAEGTDVAVTQGKVKITGVERMLRAGQKIHGTDISPLPRASHVLNWTRELMVTAESPLVPASDYGGGA